MERRIEAVLETVRRPSRYIGGEVNQVRKPDATALVDAALPGVRRPAKKAERGDAAMDGRSPGPKAPPSNRLDR